MAAFKNHAAASARCCDSSAAAIPVTFSVEDIQQAPAPRSKAAPKFLAAIGSPESAANFQSRNTSATFRLSTVLSNDQSSLLLPRVL